MDIGLAIAVGSLAAILGIRELINWLSNNKIDLRGVTDNAKVARQNSEEALKLIKELHKWHDVEQPGHPGVKMWWNKPEVEQKLDEIAKIAKDQIEVMEKIVDGQKHYGKIGENLTTAISEMGNNYNELSSELIKYLHARDGTK